MGRAAPLRDAGAAAVEFAIISLALFTLLFGILQYGLYFFQATAVESAAREAARRASIGIDTCEEWSDDVMGAMPDSVQASVTELDVRYPGPGSAVGRGDDIEVSIGWQPVSFRLVPLPRTTPETVVTRVERVGTHLTGCHRDYP